MVSAIQLRWLEHNPILDGEAITLMGLSFHPSDKNKIYAETIQSLIMDGFLIINYNGL